MANSVSCKEPPGIEHKASLPYRWYDKHQGKIMLRLIAPEGLERVTLIYGDPHLWESSGGGDPRWSFREAEMFRALSGTRRVVWKAEIELPVRRRLKYGFRIKTKGGDFYFSENGLEPYRAGAVNLPHNHFFFPFIHDVDAPSVPPWVQDRVWYQIFPDRFTERIFSILSRLSDPHNSAAFNLLDSHDTQRALNRAGGDKQALRNAFTMLFLLPGSPCVYYGDETGMTGGPEPDCRRPMIWDESKQDRELLGFFRDLISFRKTYYTIINQGIIEYKNLGNPFCWKISGAAGSLYAVYAEDTPGKLPEIPGEKVFSTGPAQNGGLAPYSMVVYHKGLM